MRQNLCPNALAKLCGAALDLEVEPEEREKADLAISMFYVLRDIIDDLADKLELLNGDCRVVDAIYAVNDVRRRDGTLKTED